MRPILAWQVMRCRGGGETDDNSTSSEHERPAKLMKTMQSTDRVDGAPGYGGNYSGNETALAELADAPPGGHLPSVADSPEHEKVRASADTACTTQDPEMEILKEALSAGPLDAHPVAMAEVTSVSAAEDAAPKAKKIRGPGPVQLPEPPPPPDHAALVAAQAIGECTRAGDSTKHRERSASVTCPTSRRRFQHARFRDDAADDQTSTQRAPKLPLYSDTIH